MKKINILQLYLIVFIILSGIGTTLVLLRDDSIPPYYFMLPYLPMFFTIGSMIFINVYMNLHKSMIFPIIIGTYYIRMVISPMLLKLAYYETSNINTDVYENMDKAIIMMIYEFVLVFVIISILIKKYYTKNNSTLLDPEFIVKKFELGHNKILISLLLIFILSCFIVYPEIRYNYRFLILSSQEDVRTWTINYLMARKQIPPLVFYLSTWAIEILRPIIVLGIILFIRNRVSVKSKPPFYCLFISTIIIVLNSLISTDNTALNLFLTISLFFILLLLYQDYKKRILAQLFVLISFVGGLGLFAISSNAGTSNVFYNLSNTIQAYFGGPVNFATALSIHKNNVLSVFFADNLQAIPLFKTFFVDMTNITLLFNQTRSINFMYVSQIIPASGQAYYYFGYVLSPIFSCLAVYLSIKNEYKSKVADNFTKKFIGNFLAIFMACIPVLYNYTIALSVILTYALPIYLILKFFPRQSKIREDVR
ncbi:hypothetical protein [Pseudobacteroides cellulosolvens]|uniref:Oligosaccharide repeat unit polymerase n=1 Tax=Pseudobacteroides cellulosolvens ATCC 35603 = DSM 2933 TaxID=398512 RepID=A0A0L6JKR0_9FIRM|nr:hypothetical protein [Pseudobacteroides cellulosolvens]KNY26374.1 hypothetical protein Bccel_1636 [Pseudobacteroides cellulosolvens ATCC 35603 = DSM 2933]